MKNYIVMIDFNGSCTIEKKKKNEDDACEKVLNSKKFANLKWNDAMEKEIRVAYADEE